LFVDVAQPSDVIVIGTGVTPDPALVATGLACEPLEGRLIVVEGMLAADPGTGDDGVLSVVDDGSGPLPVLAPTASGILDADLPVGARVQPVGVLSQLAEAPPIYRLVVRSVVDVTLIAPPPTPTPSPTPTLTPTPTPTSTPTPTATPTWTPSPSPTAT